MKAFNSEVKPHLTMLNKMIITIRRKFDEIQNDINPYNLDSDNQRFKRGALNFIGSIFKTITSNLDSSDGEYYDKIINDLKTDETQLENLHKSQILVTTSLIKNLRKLQVDEQTFNDNLHLMENAIHNITDNQNFYDAKIKNNKYL